MGKYEISGGNQGAVGDNAHAEDFTQNSVLAQELGSLKEEMLKRARTPKQIEATKHIADASDAMLNNDKQTASEKIKAAGTWALEVATDIGKDVAAKVISNQLGL